MRIKFEQALSLLRNEEIVAIPTETVYGLAGSIRSKSALEKIFETKKRPLFDPLIVHLSHYEMAHDLIAQSSPLFTALAKKFWPGPLTMVLKKSSKVNDLITAGLDSVGLRVPDHELTRSLIKKLGTPLAAPSANLFSKTSPTTAQHVLDSFNNQVPVLDGGDCQVGIESTVIGIMGKEISIFRPGFILKEDIEQALSDLKLEFTIKEKSHAASPGQLEDHYQPEVPFFITENPSPEMNELVLNENPQLAARELYAKLREFSQTDRPIYINPKKYPRVGLWDSIWERLDKASSSNNS